MPPKKRTTGTKSSHRIAENDSITTPQQQINSSDVNEQQAKTKNAQQQQSKSSILTRQIWPTVLRRFGLLFAMWLASYAYNNWPGGDRIHGNVRVMASVRDNIVDRPLAQQLPCSDHYRDERKIFPQCAPTRCGRFVGDSIVDEHEAMELRLLAETVFGLSNPSGGVAIFDFSSGALSNGTTFINLWKLIERMGEKNGLIRQKSLDTFARVRDKMMHNIAIHFGVALDQLHLTAPVFFTRITDAKARTLNDQYWHSHVDKVTYGSFAYTSLLYLSTYGTEFNGGRFIFLDAKRNVTIEPKFGRVSAFTSAAENTHRVEKVISGARFALTIPFTCDIKRAVKIPRLK